MNGNLKLAAALVAGLAGGAGAVYLALKPAAHETAAPAAAKAQRQVLYWYDPMVPDQHFDKPGKSPFMDMALVPRYADEQAGTGVSIDPRVRQSLGMRTAAAETGKLWRRIDTVGTVRVAGSSLG